MSAPLSLVLLLLSVTMIGYPLTLGHGEGWRYCACAGSVAAGLVVLGAAIGVAL